MLTALISLLITGQTAPGIDLHPRLSGAAIASGVQLPQRLQLIAPVPANFRNVPAGSTSCGLWEFDGGRWPVTEIDVNGVPSKLIIDETGKGNFAGAEVFEWKAQPTDPHKPNGFKLFRTEVSIPSLIGGDKPVTLCFYRFDPADPEHANSKAVILYYPDYALDGTVTLNDKSYHAMLLDPFARGNFDGMVVTRSNEIPAKLLLIDLNGDGKFKRADEWFDCSKPFEIGGKAYEVIGLHGSGARVAIVRYLKPIKPPKGAAII